MENKLIFEKIAAMISEVEAIGKDRKNEKQGYKFRGIDDMYNSLHPVFAKHKVFLTSEVLDQFREERSTNSGGNMIYTRLLVKFTFYTTDGSNVSSTMVGEGSDMGDKSSNKAMSTALKYALMQLLLIPTEYEKDTETQSPEFKPKQQPTPTAKPATSAPNAQGEKDWFNLRTKEGQLTELGKKTLKALADGTRTIADIQKVYKISKATMAELEEAANFSSNLPEKPVSVIESETDEIPF